MKFYFSKSKSFTLIFLNHFINIIAGLRRGVARLVMVLPWIYYPFFVVFRSEGKKRHSAL